MKHALARAGVLALAAGALVVTPTAAQAETEVVVFKNQVFQPDTRATGSVTWPVGGGIRLKTQGTTSTDKATFAFYTEGNEFDLGSAALGHDANIKSGGPTAEPGIQIYTADGLWVWETIYNNGQSDIWLTNSASHVQLRALAPSCDGDPALATMTSDAAIAAGKCTGGSGSAWHGSEADWATALSGAGYDPAVLALGESLGSGVFGNVLVTSINAGQTFWTFSRADAPVPEPVVVDPATRVQVTVDTSCRQAVFTAMLPAAGPNEVYSQTSVGYRFVSAGKTVERGTVSVGAPESRTETFTRSSNNSPLMKTFRTATGQAAGGYPNVFVEQENVFRNCSTVGAPTP